MLMVGVVGVAIGVRVLLVIVCKATPIGCISYLSQAFQVHQNLASCSCALIKQTHWYEENANRSQVPVHADHESRHRRTLQAVTYTEDWSGGEGSVLLEMQDQSLESPAQCEQPAAY